MKWAKRLQEIERLKAKHGKARPDFRPNLKVEQRTAPLGNRFAKIEYGKQRLATQTPAGFVVGNLHKQGITLISTSDLEWSGGKKS